MAKGDKMKKEKYYQCVGENFGFDCRIGFCGDVHTIDKWVEILFANNVEKAKEYFDGAKETEIIEYILKYKGKRLKLNS